MAQKSLADLINSGARKSVKRVSSYTQGNIRQTNIREARGRSDVGGQSAEMAEFLKGTMKVGGFALDAHNKASNEEAQELARQAKADYKNATPEQLQKYRDGERMGVFLYLKILIMKQKYGEMNQKLNLINLVRTSQKSLQGGALKEAQTSLRILIRLQINL